MSHWKLGTKPDDNGQREAFIDIETDDRTGHLKGTVTFQQVAYSVTGHWAAAGSVEGRNYSCLAMCGPDGSPAPEMIALAGTLAGKGAAPSGISANLIRTDSKTGQQYGFHADMVPM